MGTGTPAATMTATTETAGKTATRTATGTATKTTATTAAAPAGTASATAPRLLEAVPDRRRGAAAPSSPPVLHGRDRELEIVGALLDRVRDGDGGALAVLAGPGLGKTALLEAAAVRAGTGFRTLRARGVRQECSVPYAGLHRLLHPVAAAAGRLPETLAASLAPLTGGPCADAAPRPTVPRPRSGGEQADGNGLAAPSAPSTPSAPFTLYTAVCALLAEAAADGPLLCLVDDAHLLDRVSLEALAFAARRLSGTPVAMVFAARPGPAASPVAECLADIPPLCPEPLDEDASLRVLQDLTRGALDEESAADLAELAAGVPLALVELAGALTPEQLSGTAPPPRALPPHSALRSHYRRRYLRLTTGARRLVLMAAADDRLDLNTLARAAGEDGIDLRELEWARASGLITVDGDRVRMPDALVRSSLYADATPAERRAVHGLLARALDRAGHEVRRAWHRAALAERPDDDLADELARAAESLQEAGEHEEAARTWQRSAALTAAPEIRADRYIAAARQAWSAGRTRRARAMLRRVRPCTSDPGRIGRADLLQGEIEMCDGLPVMALWILQEAADRLAEADPALAMEALAKAQAAADTTGDHHCYRTITSRALALPRPATGPEPVMEMFRDYFAGLKATVKGRPEEAERLLRRVVAAAEEIEEPTVRSWASVAAIALGDDRRARDLAARGVAGARGRGGIVVEPRAMTVLAHCEIFLGRYPAAEATAREGMRLSRAAGQRNQLIEQRALLALLAAFRGDRETALELLDGLAEEGARRGLIRATSLDTWAMACLDLADDRPDDAAARLRHPAGSGSGYPILRLLAVPHLVEAAVRTGRRGTAMRAFAAFERWVGDSRAPVRRALAERCRALLAEDDEAAGKHFEEALRLHEDGDSAFELARTALLYGHRLRRGRRPRDARPHLRNAAQIFQRAGAERWAERALAELRAAGETLERPAAADGADAQTGPLAELTAQQLQIARLVAGGATNREIAARLVISPRTVDGHLRNIFTRLGLRSRIELARLFH